MKETELRIGNLVSMPDKSVKEISAIDLFQFSEHFSPIPLTEEWMEKFGFEKSNEKPFGYWKFLDYYKIRNFEITHEDDFRFVSHIEAPLKYVHQLQNLYFALTNSELQIKQTV